MPDAQQIQDAFKDLQDRICDFLNEENGEPYYEDRWDYDKGSGGGRTRVAVGRRDHRAPDG